MGGATLTIRFLFVEICFRHYLKTNKVKCIKVYIFRMGNLQEIYLNRQIFG